jgi:hypothetical protein
MRRALTDRRGGGSAERHHAVLGANPPHQGPVLGIALTFRWSLAWRRRHSVRMGARRATKRSSFFDGAVSWRGLRPAGCCPLECVKREFGRSRTGGRHAARRRHPDRHLCTHVRRSFASPSPTPPSRVPREVLVIASSELPAASRLRRSPAMAHATETQAVEALKAVEAVEAVGAARRQGPGRRRLCWPPSAHTHAVFHVKRLE